MAYRQRRGLRGLGQCMSVSDMVAACGGTGTGACNPLDSGCVANNQAIIDYAEDLQDSFSPPCIPEGTPCGYTSPGAAVVTQNYLSNQPIYSGGPPAGVTVASTMQLPSGATVYTWSNGAQTSSPTYGGPFLAQPGSVANPSTYGQGGSPIVPANPVSIASPTIQTTPSGSAIVNSSGASGSTAPGPASTTQTVSTASNWFTDSMIDSIPNWALLAAAAVGVYLFMGHHGR
jgi:hypothetical protein